MADKLVGLGAGGHAKVVIETLQVSGAYELTGLLDPDPALVGTDVLGVPVLGGDDLLVELKSDGVDGFFVGVGSTGDTGCRRRLFDLGSSVGLVPVTVIHPSAVVSRSAEIGAGTVVMAGAVMNACTVIGRNAIVNTGAVVEHDCRIGDHAHVATGAKVCGCVSIGEGAHIGAGAVIRQAIAIGANSIVGAGAVVINDIGENITVKGVPAR